MSKPTSLKEILTAVEEAGWRVKQGQRHYQCYSPDGVGRVTVSSTPGDFRATNKIISNFRTNGLELRRSV